MPRIKRWFPVSHDINADPEVWAMRREIGEKSLSIWLEILSVSDRNESELPGDYEQLVRTIAGRCQATVRTVSAVFDFAKTRMWLKSDPTLRVVNYGKYHKSRDANRIPHGNGRASLPSEPSEPSYPKSPKKDSPRNPSEVSVSDFCESWNRCFKSKLPEIRLPLSSSRERKLKLRLREHPAEQFWTEVFTAIANSDFLMGRNGDGSDWRASFDWIVENDKNCLKVAEGNYANKH